MAALTSLDQAELAEWLPQYGVGELSDFQRISTGIENSNYFVSTTDTRQVHQLVVTILEQNYPSRDLLVPLASTLQQAGLPVPKILPTKGGQSVVTLAGKPAILSTRLPGAHPVNPTSGQCVAVGRFLARFHIAGQGARNHANLFVRDLDWLQNNAEQVASYLPFADQALLTRSLGYLKSLLTRKDLAALPTGVVHGDLFRDNVLFNERGLSGVLDFTTRANIFCCLISLWRSMTGVPTVAAPWIPSAVCRYCRRITQSARSRQMSCGFCHCL